MSIIAKTCFGFKKVLSSKHPFDVTLLACFHLSFLLHLLFLPHSCFSLCQGISSMFMFSLYQWHFFNIYVFFYINGKFSLLQGLLWTKEKKAYTNNNEPCSFVSHPLTCVRTKIVSYKSFESPQHLTMAT